MIASKNCGEVVKNNINGFIFEEINTCTIKNALKNLMTNIKSLNNIVEQLDEQNLRNALNKIDFDIINMGSHQI